MLPPNTDKDWEFFGKVSPYFGVHSDVQFLPENLDETAMKEFFASGERQVEEIVQAIKASLKPDFSPTRCLDFGCGVGRLVLPLAKRFRSVVGVDVSRSMIAEARRNIEKYGIGNAEFVESDDELTKVSGTFDFIFSYIVMQHIQTIRGEHLFKRLIGLLNPGGVGALHFTYSLEGWLRSATRRQKIIRWVRESVPGMHKLSNLARGRRFNDPFMRMNAYDLNRLFGILQNQGCKQVQAQFTDHGGFWGLILIFAKEEQS